jgi:hypothetical protein
MRPKTPKICLVFSKNYSKPKVNDQKLVALKSFTLNKLNAAVPKMENERKGVFLLLNKINDEIFSIHR